MQQGNLMLTVKQCREILDKEAVGLTDADIILIRDWLSDLADLLIETSSKTKTVNKKQTNDKKSNYLYPRFNR